MSAKLFPTDVSTLQIALVPSLNAKSFPPTVLLTTLLCALVLCVLLGANDYLLSKSWFATHFHGSAERHLVINRRIRLVVGEECIEGPCDCIRESNLE